MARDINRTRMRDTRVLVGIVLLAGFFTSPVLREESFAYEAVRLAGYILLCVCTVGRIYSTTFIGGTKNEKLVISGPYSMCRNPLYFYSLLGVAGLGLMSGQAITLAIVFGGFLLVYVRLIKREEAFLSEKFGKDFAAFKASTPRLLPNIRKYVCPDELVFQPRYLTMAVWDSLWWLAPPPLFELARLLHHAGIIKPLFFLL
ncbi:MAG: isoprenylcysteine carboxylmethyltransferase family protein [Pseudomonadota bacterium]